MGVSAIERKEGRMKCQVVLVTGAAGFIGRNLTETLLRRGYRVIALDWKECRYCCGAYRCVLDFAENVREWELRKIRGDIRDHGLLQRIFCRYAIDYVIHLAALSTIQMGARNERKTRSVNVGGTENLLNIVRDRRDVKGFLYASTDKVYGELRSQAYTEQDALTPLNSPYDESKREADEMVHLWWEEHGVQGIVLRFCNIYGRYDRQKTRIIPGTIQAIQENRECVLRMYRGDDGQLHNYQRDFLYVEDLCEAITKILNKLETWNREGGAQWGQAFNLGSCCHHSIGEVVRILRAQMNAQTPLQIEITETISELRRQHMDYNKARLVFGFEPLTPLEDGLRETIAWWKREQQDRKNDR